MPWQKQCSIIIGHVVAIAVFDHYMACLCNNCLIAIWHALAKCSVLTTIWHALAIAVFDHYMACLGKRQCLTIIEQALAISVIDHYMAGSV